MLEGNEDENAAKSATKDWFEAEKGRLELGESSVKQKSESPQKEEYLKHINQEKENVARKLVDLETKSKVQDIKALIDQEQEERNARIETEHQLLEKISAKGTNAPEAIKQQLVEARKNTIDARNQATGQEEGNKNNVRYDPTDPDLVSIFGDGNNEQVPQRPKTASAESQTPQPSGVTVKNVEMVCNKLKKKIIALEEQIAKLQESNTETSSNAQKHKIITTTNPQKANKGTSNQSTGGRKSRNNKKKKKSKAKKNKTRRRRRSKA